MSRRDNNISNSDDIIDSRDVIARIEELQAEREALAENLADVTDDTSALKHEAEADEAKTALAEWDTDNGDELKALLALQNEAEGYASDWRHGEALISDSHFEAYAQQLAEDMGAINKDASWPNTCIDWEQAARELQQDYTSVDFDGTTYWIRSS